MSKTQFRAIYLILVAILFVFVANGVSPFEMTGEQAVYAGIAIASFIFSGLLAFGGQS